MSEEALQIYEKRREVKGNGERERYTQGGIPGGSVGKETSCNAGVPGLIPARSLEKEMATHSSVLAWRIPPTEQPDGLQSTGSRRVGHY